MKILLAEPRGFCAGVDRAIAIVERALEHFLAPVYVRHEIVHNRRVVETLRRKGAVFVHELDEVPDGATVIFSAHGVAKSVVNEGQRRSLHILDATCPLVERVHRAATRFDDAGMRVILIGHRGHPEVVGTMGQLPSGRITLVATEEDVALLDDNNTQPVGYITQTTLSVDETARVVTALKQKFPAIHEQSREDICYATQNRQNAVKQLALQCEVILVLGAPNSSNSNRLREVAQRSGARAHLIEQAEDIDLAWLKDGPENKLTCLGITAGASAPEILIDEVLQWLQDRMTVTTIDTLTTHRSWPFATSTAGCSSPLAT
ncbi:MAG: 4-hydroxy-3-methylbut-2-enyl diphosphate reductase, partial [Magnetococcales bacterium]|nr:4-hydroxy-3-methylbut-2-enyl diphosphate reductase [Magnetococcales bacterium]